MNKIQKQATEVKRLARAYGDFLVMDDSGRAEHSDLIKATVELDAAIDALASAQVALPQRAKINHHKGGSQAYYAIEHWNEGWNACIDSMLSAAPPAPAPVEPIVLTVLTRHPNDYTLINGEDGTIWRGGVDGKWHHIDPAPPAPVPLPLPPLPGYVVSFCNGALNASVAAYAERHDAQWQAQVDALNFKIRELVWSASEGAALRAAPTGAQPLTPQQRREGFAAVDEDPDADFISFSEGIEFAERAHGIVGTPAADGGGDAMSKTLDPIPHLRWYYPYVFNGPAVLQVGFRPINGGNCYWNDVPYVLPPYVIDPVKAGRAADTGEALK